MSSNEPFLFSIGQMSIMVEGADFLTGYLKGYEHFRMRREEGMTETELYHFLATHISDVHHSGVLNAGYITGYIAALVEVVPGDCQMHPPV